MKKKIIVALGILGFTAFMAIAIIGAVIIAKANVMKSMPTPAGEGQEPLPAGEGQELLTLEYLSEKKSEDDAQSTATITFYSDKTCHISGLIANMYKWEYSTVWSADGGLHIVDEETVTADCVEELKALAAFLKLELSYELDMQYTSSSEGENIRIDFKGVYEETGETLMECFFVLSPEDAAELGVSAGK